MLRYRAELQRLVTGLSTKFINLATDEIDSGINHALQEIGEFAGVDRSYIFLFYDNLTKMDNTHEWCAQGIEPQIQNSQGFLVKDFPWCEKRIKRFETIRIPRVSDLPPEAIEKQVFESQQIQSLIVVPMVYDKCLYGFVGFDSVRMEKVWPEDIIAPVGIAGEIFANALERKRTEQALRQSENKYRTLLENLPQKIFQKDRNSVYVSCNERYARDLKIRPEEICGKTDYEFFPKELAEKYMADDKRIIALGKTEAFEEKYIQDGEEIWVRTVKTPVRNDRGDITGVLGIFWDITEQKQAEDALRRSEEKYSGLVEASLTGVYIDQDSKIVFANRKFAEIYGYSRKELEGIASWKLVHPEDRALTNEIRTRRLKGKDVPSEYEARGLTKDGRTIWIKRRNTLIDYRARPAVLGNVVDTTKRKLMQNALQESAERLRLLSSHLLTARERERRRISLELHDDMGQVLTALKLQLRSLERGLREDQQALRADCEHAVCYVDQIIDNVRRLSRDLSPSILEDLGLSAALRWLTDDVCRHYNIEFSVEIQDVDDLFSKEAQIIIYRIFQEALTNIGRHAHATHVSVVVKKKDGNPYFMVKDNGNGFDVEDVRAKACTEKGLGLEAMDERVRMLGGSLEIWSEPGAGTRITFTVPIGEL